MARAAGALLLLLCLAGAASAAPKPHILQIVADDLGKNDLGIRNGNKTITPAIDNLINEGVTLSAYYTFKLCSPTRASLMTGRYPWGLCVCVYVWPSL